MPGLMGIMIIHREPINQLVYFLQEESSDSDDSEVAARELGVAAWAGWVNSRLI